MSIQQRLIARHRWLNLYAGHFGEPFVACQAGVQIVPLTAHGEVLFIREPFIPDGAARLTLPGGVIDPGEAPEVSANRELQEEIGYRAERLDYLGKFNPLGKHADWDIYYYLGRDLTPSQLRGDEEYPIVVEAHALTELEYLIAAGELTVSSIIAALYMARSFLVQER